MPPARDPVSIVKSFACLVLCALVSACGDKAGPGAGGGAEAPVSVTLATVSAQPWSDTIAALGTVKARESVDVTAKVSETVQRVHFDSGDEVGAGALLVTLSGQQQQASLTAAQAAADEAGKLLARQDQLVAQQLIARASVDTQRAVRDAARARVAEIRANLGDRTIRAPFAGVLGLRQVSPGALVQPGTVVATLDDLERVYVDFPVPEAQIANLAQGQQLRGSTTAYPGRRFDGEVSIVDARVDPTSRSVVVRGDFANDDRVLRPGMLMEIELERPQRQALLVSEIAIVQVGRDSFVYRAKGDGTAEQVPVEIGARRDGLAEVTEGLSAGDRIVIDGTGKLRPGAKIVAAPRSAAPPRGEAAPDTSVPTAVAAPAERAR